MEKEQVFSEYELEKQFIKVAGSQEAVDISCTSTCNVKKTLKKATKKCRGMTKKRKPRVIGMEIEVGAHIPRSVLIDINGLGNKSLKQGVNGVSRKNIFKEFLLTQDVRDEDDISLFKAYPRCILSEPVDVSIDNSSDDVVETTLKITVMPDDNDFFEYEGIKDELEPGTQSAWLKNFTDALVFNKEI